PPRVVPGEASESDSEAELPLGAAGGVPGIGLKVPGEASETDDEDEDDEEEERSFPSPSLPHPKPLSVPPVEEPAAVWGSSSGGSGTGSGTGAGSGPSLLQQRLREGSGRLRGAVGSALRLGYGSAARHLAGLGQALGRAQASAAAAAHCLRLARRDLSSVAATVDIVTACRLLPDIRCQPPPPGTRG
ncbi:BL1S3 protein, partial [Tricholaema leucomelas]|nr:BL1S3 protein [Tricholaema leucomelas]